MNCAETIQDRAGQPAYEMFGINPFVGAGMYTSH